MSGNSVSVGTQSKPPMLSSSEGVSGGLPYSKWRPQMIAFLMQQGIEERDYSKPIEKWGKLMEAMDKAAEDEERFSMEVMLGEKSPIPIKAEEEDPTKATSSSGKRDPMMIGHEKAKLKTMAYVSRVKKAYGFLFAALPSDIRVLITEVKQGYAFGIWDYLEKKYRNTEQDSIGDLWRRITSLQQEDDETFEMYKAKIDSVMELLTHAKQKVEPGLYMSLLLWRLQPAYSTVILALQTSGKLKDSDKIDWKEIGETIAQYERNQMSLGGTEYEGQPGGRAMAAVRGKPSSSSAHPHIKCYNCQKMGHYKSDCPLPIKNKNYQGRGKSSRQGKSGAHRRSDAVAQGSSSETESEDDEGAKSKAYNVTTAHINRMNIIRTVNNYDVLSGDEEDDQLSYDRATPPGPYLARVMAGMTSSARPPATLSKNGASDSKADDDDKPRQLKRLKRPNEYDTKKDEKPEPKPQKKNIPTQAKTPARKSDKVPLEVALKTTARAVDTGATVHITGNKDCLVNVRRCMPMPIQMADRTIVSAVYKGDMPLRLDVSGGTPDQKVKVAIRDVYYHERIEASLLSWGCMRLDKWQFHSDSNGTYLITPGGKRVDASTRAKLTLLEDAGPERAYAARMGRIVCNTVEDLVLLHQRVGHASWTQMMKMCNSSTTIGIGDVSGMSQTDLAKAKTAVRECVACTMGKQRKNALGHRGLDTASEGGEVLHMDVFYLELIDPQTNKKYHEYGLITIDDYTELRWITVTRSLVDIQDVIINTIRKSRNYFNRMPRKIIADLGSEFNNKKVKGYTRDHGIQLQMAPPRAKEMNGVSEKGIDTVKNHVRAMLLASKVPEAMGFARALYHHVYVWNRTHVGKNTNKTPYEATLGRTPSVTNIGVFGCDAFVHQDRSQRKTTFSPKARPGIYLGHDYEQNCSVVYMLHSGKTIRAKDVIFREGTFKHVRAYNKGRADEVDILDLSDYTEQVEEEFVRRRELFTSVEYEDDNEVQERSHIIDEEEDGVPTTTEERYTIKAIRDKRIGPKGVPEYQVKWAGYSALTWEPASQIQEDAPDAVREYDKFIERRENAVVTRRRAAATSQASSSTSSAVSSRQVGDSDDDEEERDEAKAMLAARLVAAKCL